MNKRQLIKNCSLVVGGGIATILASHLSGGVRFPFVQGEPSLEPTDLVLLNPNIQLSLDGAYIQTADRTNNGIHVSVRAFSPQPKISIQSQDDIELSITIKNISADALLQTTFKGALHESPVTRINRSVVFKTGRSQMDLQWQVPFVDQYRFTAIGDSGAGVEFNWCLHRSAELKANFILHLGDVFYDKSDIEKFEDNMDRSPLPIYMSIGNHDFQKSGRNLHPIFSRVAGPLNSIFRLGKTTFVNYDTSASTWPSSSGYRSEIFESAHKLKSITDQWVFMTHRPFHDPRQDISEDKKHILSEREHEYVLEQIFSLDSSPTLLAGHIHVSADIVEDRIRTFVAGEGLATRNIAAQADVAKILVGDQLSAKKIEYSWHSLGFPKELHCHSKAKRMRKKLNSLQNTNDYGESCSLIKQSTDS